MAWSLEPKLIARKTFTSSLLRVIDNRLNAHLCLRLLPRFPVLSIFPSITTFRRHFLRKMQQIQLAFLLFEKHPTTILNISNSSPALHTWAIHPSGLDHTDTRLSHSQCPRDLSCRFATTRLLRLWVRISCECCVLSSRGHCDKLITRQGRSYRLWCVVELDLGTSRMRRPWPALGRSAIKYICMYVYIYIFCKFYWTSYWPNIICTASTLIWVL